MKVSLLPPAYETLRNLDPASLIFPPAHAFSKSYRKASRAPDSTTPPPSVGLGTRPLCPVHFFPLPNRYLDTC